MSGSSQGSRSSSTVLYQSDCFTLPLSPRRRIFLATQIRTHGEETQKPQRYLTFHMPRSTSDKKKKKNKKRGKDSTHQANDDIVADSSEGVLSDGVSSESSLDVPSKDSPGRPKRNRSCSQVQPSDKLCPFSSGIQKKDGLLYTMRYFAAILLSVCLPSR